jgi:hypothetical protein
LSTTNPNVNFNTIQFAWYLRSDGVAEIFESGNSRGTFGSYTANSIFRISVEANVVKYFLNGTLRYISAVSPSLPMLVDVSINNINGTITNAKIGNLSGGTFTAVATVAGPAPTYQWQLNGINDGINSSTYTNSNLANNDVVTCKLTPNLGGCAGIVYTSNTIINRTISSPTSIDFYIQGTVGTTACNTADEQVKWKVSDLVNTEASTNNLSKIQSNGNWDGGAASWNTVANNGYFQFTATETNASRMVGLSTTNTNSNFNTIQFAWFLRNDGVAEIYESGNSRGTFGAYANGNINKIGRAHV